MQAALIALTFLLGGLIGRVHEATTTHVRCAEHGELVHVGTVASKGLGALTRATSDAVARDVSDTKPHDVGHEHEHCLLASVLLGTMAVRCAPAIPLLASVDDPIVVSPPPFVRYSELYRTAPKTSPPTIA